MSRSSLKSGMKSPSSRKRVGTTSVEDNVSPICLCPKCQLRFPTEHVAQEMERIADAKPNVLSHIVKDTEQVLENLSQLIKFKSVSVEPTQLLESCKALDWLANRLAEMKFNIFDYIIPDNPNNCFVEPHQKVLFANYLSSPSKITLLIYAHLDVLPADPKQWVYNPFELNIVDGRIYGRGVSSGKGMLVGWLHAFACWKKELNDLPINVKIIVDMMHEVGSTGLNEHIRSKQKFFLDVDYVVFDVNSSLNDTRPVVACSLTGWVAFGLKVFGANKNLESGRAGGLVFEPMIDLCHLMNSLVNDQQEVQIPNMELNVKRISTAEYQLLEDAEFFASAYKENLFVRRLRNEMNKVELLQNRWCRPALTMHGVQGSDHLPGMRKILPMNVTGKFSIKLVPDQEIQRMYNNVVQYIDTMDIELNLGTTVKVNLLDGIEPMIWSKSSKHMNALIRAVHDSFQIQPIVTPGIPICLPIANVIQKLIRKPIMLLPFSIRSDLHRHMNESIDEYNIILHAKTCACLLYELSQFRGKCKCRIIDDYCDLRGNKENQDSGIAARNQKNNKKLTFSNTYEELHKREKKGSKFKKLFSMPTCLKKGTKQKPSAK